MNSGKCVIGGDTDESEKYIAPTVLTGVKPTDPLMENEVHNMLIMICTGTWHKDNFRDCVATV